MRQFSDKQKETDVKEEWMESASEEPSKEQESPKKQKGGSVQQQVMVGAGILLLTVFAFTGLPGSGEEKIRYDKVEKGQEPEYIRARD